MIADLIIKRSKDKDIVFWGGWDNTELIQKIEKKKKIKFVCVSPKTTKCTKKLEHIATLSGKNDQYFIVVFPKETKEIREMFQNFGYSSEDIFYMNHIPVLAEKDGIDRYGNTLKGFDNLNQKIKVCFEGYGACVDLGEHIVGENLEIIIGGETKLEIGDNCKFLEKFTVTARNLDDVMKSEIKIGDGCSFISGAITSFGGGVILGSNSTYESEFRVTSGYGMTVNIGSKCMFSHDIFLYGGDGHTIYDVNNNKVLNSVNSMSLAKKRLNIGNHVWVGLRSVILNGSDIGDGSIVGAVSFVKRRFPNNCMIAGNPARVLRENIAWSRNPISIDDAQMFEDEELYYNLTIEEGEQYEYQ